MEKRILTMVYCTGIAQQLPDSGIGKVTKQTAGNEASITILLLSVYITLHMI